MSDQQNPGTEIPEEAVVKVARERWTRSRVEAQVERNAATADWEHLSIETQEQKLHEARQDLEAALPSLTAGLSRELEEVRAELAEHTGGHQWVRLDRHLDLVDEFRTKAEAAEHKLVESGEALAAVRRAVDVLDEWGADNAEKSEEEGDVPDERYKAFALAASFVRSKLPLATLDYEQPTEPITVTLGSGQPVKVGSEEVAQAIRERDVFAALAGWDYEGDGEHQIQWDFERVRARVVETQHEDAPLPEQPTDERGGSGWKVGQILRHPAGSAWELIEHIGGDEDDWRARRTESMHLGGGGIGDEKVFHREYMDRTFTIPGVEEGLPLELLRALRDPSVTIAADREYRLANGQTLAEHLEEWRNAPSNTVSVASTSTPSEPEEGS